MLGGSTRRFAFSPKLVLPVSGAEVKLLRDGEVGPFDAAVIREADN